MIKQMKIGAPTGAGKTKFMAEIMSRAVKEFGVERILHITPHNPLRSQLVRRLDKQTADHVFLCDTTRLPQFLPDDLVVLDEMPSYTRFLIETRLKDEAVRVISFHDMSEMH